MGIWISDWSKDTLTESYKFWFYSLAFSILGSTWQLLCLAAGPKAKTKKPAATVPSKPTTIGKEDEPIYIGPRDDIPEPRGCSELMADLIVSSCDILIPGTFVGWIDAPPLIVSGAAILSTVLLGRRRWNAAQE